MLLVAESLGMKAISLSITTKAIPGHLVVDAYDKETNSSYILDATFNVMIISRGSNGKSLLERVLIDGEAAAGKLEMVQLPSYFRFVDPGDAAFTSTAVTAQHINLSRDKQLLHWRTFLNDELVAYSDTWRSLPPTSIHLPSSLEKWQGYLKSIPAEFNSSAGFEKGLMNAAMRKQEIAAPVQETGSQN
jgi:hypothetical protein